MGCLHQNPAATVVREIDAVEVYLTALEPTVPDVGARMLVAQTLRGEQRPEDAIDLLDDVIREQAGIRDRRQLPAAYVLLAELQCESGNCPLGIQTLEAGLGLFPDDEGLRDALQRMRQGAW